VWEGAATATAKTALARGTALRVLFAWWDVVREAAAARAELRAEAELRAKLEALLARARQRTLRLLFSAWVTRTTTSARARALARQRILRGPTRLCFSAWVRYTAQRAAQTWAAAEFIERRKFSLMARAWDALVEARDRGRGGGAFIGDYKGRASPPLPNLQ